MHIIRQDLTDEFVPELLLPQEDQILHRHLVLGDGAGLIHAEDIHPGQGLDGGHGMAQGLSFQQPQDTGHQGKTGEEIEPLGDHADHRGHGAGDGGMQVPSQPAPFLPEDHQAQGDHHEADDLYQTAQGPHHLRLAALAVLLGLQGQAGGKGLRPHGGEPGAALPRHHKAAGIQGVSRSLAHLVLLAGDEGFVHLHLSGQHPGVRADLVALGKDRHVVPHQLAGGHRQPVPFPDHPGLRGDQDLQFIQRMLAPQLLDDADGGIEKDDAHEGEVQPGADQDDAYRQEDEEHIEIGEYVGEDDLPHRAGRGFHREVGAARCRPLRDLGQSQAVFGGNLRRRHSLKRLLSAFFLHARIKLLSSPASVSSISTAGEKVNEAAGPERAERNMKFQVTVCT